MNTRISRISFVVLAVWLLLAAVGTVAADGTPYPTPTAPGWQTPTPTPTPTGLWISPTPTDTPEPYVWPPTATATLEPYPPGQWGGGVTGVGVSDFGDETNETPVWLILSIVLMAFGLSWLVGKWLFRWW